VYKENFAAFVRKAAEVPPVDQEEKINEFRTNLYNLYDNITSWLKEYIDNGQIVIETDRVFVFGDHLEYKLPSLQITLGHKKIWLNPRGVNFKGEGGRLDMNGEADTVSLSLQHFGGPWEVCDTFSSIDGSELTDGTFFQAFMKVCAG
jgi:Tfp pilus assembly protein PilZ